MKNYNRIANIWRAAIVIIIAAFATLQSCTTQADYTLGSELTPTNQQMLVRFRSYSNGKIKRTGEKDVECKLLETRLFKTDSVYSTSLDKLHLGLQKDERFGIRKLGFASQYLFMSGISDTLGFGYRPVYDSMVFNFAVDTFAGDTTKPIKFNVFALTDDLASKDKDTLYYTSFDPFELGLIEKSAKPIYTFEFPDASKGVYTTSTAVRMHETEATDDFIKKLLCLELDASGNATGGAAAYQSDSAFLQTFKGLYIEPADDEPEGEGFAVSFVPDETGFNVLGRMRNSGVDQDIMGDTIDVKYVFVDEYIVGYGNVSAQSVKCDYSQTEFNYIIPEKAATSYEEVELGFVDGCGGVATALTFTDEFLYSLRKLNEGNENYTTVAINQAALNIYVEGADYDYLSMDPIVMADKMDHSLSRLGLYLVYKNKTPIPDYLYSSEASGNTLVYNGYVNRSLARYEMNITSYIQVMVGEVLALEPDAQGKLDFSKLSQPRTIYLGAEATDFFTFHRSVVQGANSAFNKAPIELKLTYTLVK